MNHQEALRILEEVLSEFRREPYEQLTSRIGPSSPVVLERAGAGGPYQLEILFMWDGRPGGDVRVIGSIDDGGWRAAFAPLTRSFIKAADGSFVGE
jgi:hypothetical protein